MGLTIYHFLIIFFLIQILNKINPIRDIDSLFCVKFRKKTHDLDSSILEIKCFFIKYPLLGPK